MFDAAPPTPGELDEAALREALTVRLRRRVRRDTTVPVDGKDYELDQGHLAGRIVNVCRCLVDVTEPPWVEFEDKRYALHPVDAVKNARRKRSVRKHLDERVPRHPAFDPPRALLDKATGKKSAEGQS